MTSNILHSEIVALRQSFFDEGILEKQFCMLEELEQEGNLHFVEEVITLFIRDSTKTIATVEQKMSFPTPDFVELNRLLHKLKGSSASVGAIMVRTQVELTRTCLVQRNMKGASAALENLKREQVIFKAKLEHYLKMLSEAGSGEASKPPK